MNQYEQLAESYEILLKQNRSTIDRDEILRNIDILRFLAKQSATDIRMLFDTGAFNNICIGYMKMAMQNCKLDQSTQEQMIDELKNLFDTTLSAEAEE